MWTAGLAGSAASWALIVARGWLAFEITSGSSRVVGLTTFAAMAPLFLVPPFIGVLADKVDRRNLVAWTLAIDILQSVVLSLLAITGAIEVWHLVTLAAVNGVARAAQMPSVGALVPNLVPKERLLNALSLNAATLHGSRLIGPVLIAPLLVTVGVGGAFVLCVISYSFGLVQVLRVRTRSTGGVTAEQHMWPAFVDGMVYVYRHRLIRSIIILTAFHCALTMAYESVLPTLADQRLQAGASGFNTLMIAVGAGSLVGSVWIAGVRGSLNQGRILLAVGVLSGLSLAGLGLATNMTFALVSAALAGGSQGAYMTQVAAITQSLADDKYRGRVASIFTFHLGGSMALVNLVNGELAESIDVSLILAATGSVFVIMMIASFGNAVFRRIYTDGVPAPLAVAH